MAKNSIELLAYYLTEQLTDNKILSWLEKNGYKTIDARSGDIGFEMWLLASKLFHRQYKIIKSPANLL